jgi:hypothetical protein
VRGAVGAVGCAVHGPSVRNGAHVGEAFLSPPHQLHHGPHGTEEGEEGEGEEDDDDDDDVNDDDNDDGDDVHRTRGTGHVPLVLRDGGVLMTNEVVRQRLEGSTPCSGRLWFTPRLHRRSVSGGWMTHQSLLFPRQEYDLDGSPVALLLVAVGGVNDVLPLLPASPTGRGRCCCWRDRLLVRDGWPTPRLHRRSVPGGWMTHQSLLLPRLEPDPKVSRPCR